MRRLTTGILALLCVAAMCGCGAPSALLIHARAVTAGAAVPPTIAVTLDCDRLLRWQIDVGPNAGAGWADVLWVNYNVGTDKTGHTYSPPAEVDRRYFSATDGHQFHGIVTPLFGTTQITLGVQVEGTTTLVSASATVKQGC